MKTMLGYIVGDVPLTTACRGTLIQTRNETRKSLKTFPAVINLCVVVEFGDETNAYDHKRR